MLQRDRIIEHFEQSLQSGKKRVHPYLHYEFQPFSDELYADIVGRLPDDSVYRPLEHGDAMRPDGTCSRMVFPINKETTLKLDPERREFFRELNDVMCSDEVKEIFVAALEPELVKRFGCPPSEITAIPKLMLMRDFSSYKINIHHDADWKVITTQYYLPDDDSRPHLGTGIYERRGPSDYVQTHKIPFVPKTAYCFSVSKYSWHGVEPVGELDRARNSMMLLYFRSAGYEY